MVQRGKNNEIIFHIVFNTVHLETISRRIFRPQDKLNTDLKDKVN